jgi:phosphoenolpyruvate synthase/pyruvate phosphate dikinase
MGEFLIRFDAPGATDPERVGPKAANLAALAGAGLPTPGGFALTADAYRRQIAHLGLEQTVAGFTDADMRQQRRLSVEIRLKLYQERIAPEILAPLMDAWRVQRAASGQGGAIRSSALIVLTPISPDSLKASSASSTRRNSSPRFAPAGQRCGPPMRVATWRTTGSIPHRPRWRC